MKQPHDDAAVLTKFDVAPSKKLSAPWVLAATILGSSMAFIDGTVVNVALPALQSSLHATVMDVQWVIESYGLFLSALILVGGAVGDLVGRRLIFVLGAGLFAVASIGCGLSSNISQLVIARCVQGIGAAALVPSSLAIISASFDEKSRGQAIGTWSGFTAITTALGPVLGGWLIQHFSWHWVFFINVPLAIAVMVVSLYHVPESRTSAPQPVDWLGAVVATLGLGGVVYGFIESAALGWRHPLIMGSLIGGAGALVLFVFIERRVSAPMMPLRLFKSRNFSGANLLTLFLYAAIGTFFFLVPLNLIQIQKYSATAAGAASIPVILFLFALSRWSGGLVSRYGAKIPLVIGPLIVAVGFLLFAVPSVGGSYWKMFLGPFVVLGLGMAVSVAPLTTVVMTSVDQDRTGTASGINNAVARVAGVLSVAILGVVMVQAFGSRLEDSLSHLNLDPNTLHEIRSTRVKLAAIDVPHNVDAGTAAKMRASIIQAFIFGFRVVMVICAGLALASSVVAWLMISSGRVVAEPRSANTGHSPVTARY